MKCLRAIGRLCGAGLFALLCACNFGYSLTADEDTVSKRDYENALLLGFLVSTADDTTPLEINGNWNQFTGNGTTTTGQLYVEANNSGGFTNGVMVSDSTGFSQCNIIVRFDNSSHYMIIQNPPNNGACFTGDTNAGKYFKAVWFAGNNDGSTQWYCTLNFPGVDTIDQAIAISDTADRSDPGSSGCSGFSWTRLERI